MHIADAPAVLLDDPRTGQRGVAERLERHDVDHVDIDRRDRAVRAAANRDGCVPAAFAAERADRMVGRAVHADDLVADLEAGAVGRIAFQQQIDEVAPVDARGEDADAGIGAAAPEYAAQHVVVDVVGRQQNGMRGLELVEQQIDATGRVLQVRRGDDAGALAAHPFEPVQLGEAVLVPEALLDGIDDRIEQASELFAR